MNKRYKSVVMILGLVGIAFLVALAIKTSLGRQTPGVSPANPYEYNLDAFKTVPESLLHYKEQPGLELPLRVPRGLALDENDHLYISGDKNLLILDQDGKLQANVELDGSPGCLTVAPAGNIYISIDNAVSVLDRQGNKKETWRPLSDNMIITAITTSGDNVYVADANGRRVWKCAKSGEPLLKLAEQNKAKGIPSLIIPSPYFDLLVDKQEHLWVVNPGRHKLEQFDPDGSLISMWGKAAMQIDGFCGCCNPTYIAQLSNGSIVTSEKGLPRVKVYSPGGTLLSVVAGPSQFEPETTGLVLAVDSSDRILVLDPKKRKLRIFVKKANAAKELSTAKRAKIEEK